MVSKIILTSAALAISGTMAFAGNYDDPPVDIPPTQPSVEYDWDGFFVGLSVGASKGTYETGVSSEDETGPDVDVDGGLYALRFGYNKRSGNHVFGFDLDIGNGPNGITEQGTTGDDWRCGTGDCNVDIKTLASLRGRYGVLVSERTLAYGAAGIAFAKYEGGIEDSDQQGDTETNTGYTIGLGIEHKFSRALSGFAEINHYDLGDLEFGDDGSGNTFDGVGTFNAIRFGLNFSF